MLIFDVETREVLSDSRGEAEVTESEALTEIVARLEAEGILSRYTLISVEYLRPGVCRVESEGNDAWIDRIAHDIGLRR